MLHNIQCIYAMGYIQFVTHTIRYITIRDKVVNKYLSTAEYSLVWNKNLVMYSVISEGGGGESAATTMTTFLLLASLLVK